MEELWDFRGNTVAILGYRNEGPMVARWLRDQGVHVLIGCNEWWDEWEAARRDGFEVYSLEDATAYADVIQVW